MEDEKKPIQEETTLSQIERAEAAAARQEKATAAQKAENDRTEQLLTKQALGGKSEGASQTAAPRTKEERIKESAKEMFKGSAIEGALERHG